MRYWVFSIILLLASPALAGDYALSFPAATGDERVEVPYDASLNLPDGVTLETWFSLDATTPSAVIMGKPYDDTHTSPYFEYCMFLKSVGDIEFRIGATVLTDAAANFSTSTVYFIAMTADGTDWIIYINGTETATAANAGLPGNTNSQPLLFGLNADLGEELQGDIYEARIYNVALDSATIVAHYNMGLGTCNPETDSLKGWWMFATGSGTTAYDSSGLGNDGNLLPGAGEPDWVTGMGLNCDNQTEWRYPTDYNLGTNWTNPDDSREHDNTCATYDNTGEDYLADHVYNHNVPSGATVDSIHINNHGYGTGLAAKRKYYCALTKDSINVLGSVVLDTLNTSGALCTGSLDHIVKFASPSMSAAEANARGMGAILYDFDNKADPLNFDAVLSKIFYTPEGEAAAYGAQVITIRGQ